MLIEDYFQQIQLLVKSLEIVKLFHIETEKRGMYEGFIRAKLEFKDNSLLHLREFVYVEISPDRKMYSYQYMNSENNLTALPAIMQYSFSPCPLLSKLSDLRMYLIAAGSAVFFAMTILNITEN